MELLECSNCERRYLVPHADVEHLPCCPGDRHELRLVARSLPGRLAQIEAALNARLLGGSQDAELSMAA
jgi:hypothetical protein